MSQPGTAAMKTIETSFLRIGYEDWNPDAARTVILLHGWPDSPRCWAGVAPVLAQAGWRVLVPALRGFSPTRFLHLNTARTGQLSALGRDLLEFVDALSLHRPALVGHDWGARAAANACGLRPGAISHLALLSVGYGTNSPDQTLSLPQARNYWYHWYMATARGERSVRDDRRAFARLMWDTWSPAGWYAEEEFLATAQAFDNPDWSDVTLHSYRHRWGHAAGNPYYDADESTLNPAPVLALPTLVLHGQADTANHPDTSAGKERFFGGLYRRLVLDGVGHFPQREVPALVAATLLEFLSV